MASVNRMARRAVVGTIALAAVGLTACDNALDVEPASRIPASLIEEAQYAKLLSDGAIADFECAFNAYTAQAGTVGEEFIYTAQTLARQPYDRRAMTKDDVIYATNECTDAGVYTPLQIARQSNENVLARLKVWTDEQVAAGAGSPNRTNLIAIAATYAGYSLVLLSEGFCEMAVSSVNIDKSITYGGLIQPDSVAKLAIARFTEAIDAATTASNTNIRTTAYLGRARAKLRIGDYAGAKADAQQVPSTFGGTMVSTSDATARRRNRVYAENNATSRTLSVGEPYRSMNDPRVPVVFTTFMSPHTPQIQHVYQTKYPSPATPIPLATYEEAQLIIAEAEIMTGGAAGLALALPILNASRARGGQTPFAGATQAAYIAELIDQRRRELFAESHHLGDIIRLDIEVQPAENTASHFGGNYGSQICFPLPSAERLNNPLIGG